MASKQRISGGDAAKTCPKCGAELWDDGSCLPCDWRRVPGQPERPSGDQPGPQPSDWRRLVTAAIASLLGVFALVLLNQASSCDPYVWFDCMEAEFERFAAYSLLVMASPFALATLMPFGTPRRVVVALGTALLAAVGTLVVAIVVIVSLGRDASPLPLLIGAVAFCLTMFPAYRLAR